MLKKPNFSAAQLRYWLYYNPFTGDWVWKNPMARRLKSGAKAGGISHGYRRIKIYSSQYAAHRLAWYYVTGKWPSEQIDHKNRNKADNRWTNLRLATCSHNNANSKLRSDNTLGLKGVCRSGNKFRACIYFDKRRYPLGTFDTAEQAHVAYMKKAKELFGKFARSA